MFQTSQGVKNLLLLFCIHLTHVSSESQFLDLVSKGLARTWASDLLFEVIVSENPLMSLLL